MPTGTPAPQELKIKACHLYAQGWDCLQIAKELGVPQSTVRQWKQKKYPDDWNKKRREALAEKQRILEENERWAWSNLSRQFIQQGTAIAAMAAKTYLEELKNNPRAVPTADLPAHWDKAVKLVKNVNISPEQELQKRTNGVQAGAGVQLDKDGKASVVAFLQQTFEEAHADEG